MRKVVPLICIGTAIFLTGCARQVVRATNHGVVAIPANTNVWPLRFRDKAEKIMTEHFPEGYVIDHEEETVVGQTENIETESVGATVFEKGPFSIDTGSAQTVRTTSDETEWRIYYRRR